jgi:hypothetical protein
MLNDAHAFSDFNIGQVDDGVRIEQRRNTDGSMYWRATTRVTHVFGSPIEGGELEGFGTTEAQARERLDAELRSFNDSLWF